MPSELHGKRVDEKQSVLFLFLHTPARIILKILDNTPIVVKARSKSLREFLQLGSPGDVKISRNAKLIWNSSDFFFAPSKSLSFFRRKNWSTATADWGFVESMKKWIDDAPMGLYILNATTDPTHGFRGPRGYLGSPGSHTWSTLPLPADSLLLPCSFVLLRELANARSQLGQLRCGLPRPRVPVCSLCLSSLSVLRVIQRRGCWRLDSREQKARETSIDKSISFIVMRSAVIVMIIS